MSALKRLADAFHEGDWPMWPILVLLIIAISIVIERVIFLRKAGIVVEAQFIVGLENETAETLEETYKMACDWKPDLANWSMYTPWPFSDLFEELGDKVEIFDYEKYNFVTPIIKPAAMERGDVAAWAGLDPMMAAAEGEGGPKKRKKGEEKAEPAAPASKGPEWDAFIDGGKKALASFK